MPRLLNVLLLVMLAAGLVRLAFHRSQLAVLAAEHQRLPTALSSTRTSLSSSSVGAS